MKYKPSKEDLRYKLCEWTTNLWFYFHCLTWDTMMPGQEPITDWTNYDGIRPIVYPYIIKTIRIAENACWKLSRLAEFIDRTRPYESELVLEN